MGERGGGEAMGSLCCCLSSDHFEDYVPYQNGAIFRECPCVRCCMRWFFNTVTYQRPPPLLLCGCGFGEVQVHAGL